MTAGASSRKRQTFPIAGIGASAGGLEAFTQLLKHLPVDTGLGFVLVQHLDPQHESALTQLLARATSMTVREVTNNLRVEPNHVYVIPPNTNLGIAQGVLKLKPRPKNRGAHHPIDAFFESLAQDQRECAIGVILSGTATDGTLGLEAIKAEGGITFAQDDSAKYDSMPRSAVAAGCVDFVLKPENIAKELTRISKHPYIANASHQSVPPLHSEAERESDQSEGPDAPLASGGHGSPHTGAKQARAEANARRDQASSGQQNSFKKILFLLRNHCGVDFWLYKSATIQRRITRRMVLNKHDTVEDYAQFLRGNTRELDALYSDCLISVTSFFRNPETFELLQRKVFSRLLQQRQRDDQPLRVWVVGCSTGQEAYSIAMAFQEAQEKLPRLRKLQVFATDLNEALLDKARHGLYAKSLAHDVSPEHLRRFFVEEDGGYRVIKSLREMVVFARQNLIGDPPFSRMDLISCRNLLIYLEPNLQKKALPTFHYALKPEGFLFLGASESISGFTDLFEPVDRKHKIYSRKTVVTPAFHLPIRKEAGEARRVVAPSVARPTGLGQLGPPSEQPEDLRGELNAQREADRVMVSQFAPPGVLINAELQILQFRGPTSAWLEPPTGKASFDVLKMAREGLMLPLRAAINKAKKENKIAHRENVRVQQNGQSRTVNIEVIPLKNLRERCFLILFEESQKVGRRVPAESPQPSRSSRPSLKEPRGVAELERELAETRDYVQSIQEQHEASNEELQASNEEVQSANEELQSINEELETAKEELESSNEELTTLNEEMVNRNSELNRLNSDLLNLQTSTTLGILLLGRDLAIRRFSVPAEKQFNLMAADVGRPLGSIRHNFDLIDLEDFAAEVITSVREREREVRDKEGRWYSLRARPYFTLDNKLDGVVLVVVDITDLKRTEQEVKAARDYAEAMLRTARGPLLVLRSDLRVNTANEAFYKTFKATPDQIEDRSIFEMSGGAWNIPKLRILFEDILPGNSFFNDFEVTYDFPYIGQRTMLLSGRRLDQEAGTPPLILLALEDVTEQQRAAEATTLAAVVESSDDAILSKDLDGVITSWNKGAKRLFGYTAHEAIGQPITMLIPPDRQQEEPEILERLKRGESVNHFETIRVRKDGSPLEISLTISPIKDATGQVIGASKVARDITEHKKAEKALRESEERYRTLFNLGPVAVYSIDTSGMIQNFNRHAAELWGREPALGDTDQRFCGSFKMFRLDGSFMPHEQCPMAEVVSGKIPSARDAEVLIERPNGSRITVIVNIRPLKNDRGEVIGAINCFYDITERKRTEEALRASQNQLAKELAATQQLQETSSHLIYGGDVEALYRRILDAGIDIMRSDMASLQMLDEDEDALRLLAFRGFDPEFGQIFQLNRRDTKTSCNVARLTNQRVIVPDVETCDFIVGTTALEDHRKTGIRAVQSTPLVSRAGRLIGVISTHWRTTHQPAERELRLFDVLARQAADLIERNQAEDALRQAQSQLADRAGELERVVAERTIELREANKHLEAFVYTIAHDLRRPLRAMQGFAQVLLEEYGPGLEETGRSYAKRIEQSARFMDRLLLDLLDLSRLSHALIPLEPVSLGNLVAEVLRECEAEIQERQACIKVVSPMPSVHAHAPALGQVVTNLLTNAMKFVAPGVQPEIRIRSEEKPKAIRLWVEDNGIGIPAEFQERVFRVFERLYGTAYPGTGIGLTIVRKGVERMGGRAGVESVPGEGSRFWIELAKVQPDEGSAIS
jgi:two-component system CheB/CheR fusion protein